MAVVCFWAIFYMNRCFFNVFWGWGICSRRSPLCLFRWAYLFNSLRIYRRLDLIYWNGNLTPHISYWALLWKRLLNFCLARSIIVYCFMSLWSEINTYWSRSLRAEIICSIYKANLSFLLLIFNLLLLFFFWRFFHRHLVNRNRFCPFCTFWWHIFRWSISLESCCPLFFSDFHFFDSNGFLCVSSIQCLLQIERHRCLNRLLCDKLLSFYTHSYRSTFF